MAASNLTEAMKRYAMLMTQAANHSNSEITSSFKVARSFMFKIMNDLQPLARMYHLWSKKRNILSSSIL